MSCFLVVATIEGLYKNTQEQLLVATIILGVLHLTFEIRQFIYSPLTWIASIWNYFVWAITISTLLLELKFITFFRAIEFGGIAWTMIIGIIENALPFFVMIGFIMFAFAHSLHILLRPKNESNNSLNYEITTYNITSEESSTNVFTNLITSYFAIYMMLTGDSSYLSNWSLTDNIVLAVLVVLFSFFTTIYLMNLFIGLLNEFIGETNKKELFLYQRAKFISFLTIPFPDSISFTKILLPNSIITIYWF
ncbi:hypothetical protein C2G38_77192 [Gigaspora rosea]|uniref:Ion transport domain-containing protein n=1 Tax=Gigaspora rosea TaxID=44941 RepID=A0A397URF9_9GLOM|nr:hypothetical protein C2G38_77192 [Gigaspora rosea]